MALLGRSPGAWAQVAWDGSPATTVSATGTGVLTHLVPAGGGNRYLIVGVSASTAMGQPGQVASMMDGGRPLTKLGEQRQRNQVALEIWGLANPPEGANPVTVALAGGGAAFIAGALSFSGVDQATSVGAFVSAASSTRVASLATPGSSDGYVFAVWATTAFAVALANAPLTRVWAVTGDGGLKGAGAIQRGDPAAVPSWDNTVAQFSVVAAVPLRSAAVSPSVDAALAPDGPGPGAAIDGAAPTDTAAAVEAATAVDVAATAADAAVSAGVAGDAPAGTPSDRRDIALVVGCACGAGPDRPRSPGAGAALATLCLFWRRARRAAKPSGQDPRTVTWLPAKRERASMLRRCHWRAELARKEIR
jgi:hypothetical protein